MHLKQFIRELNTTAGINYMRLCLMMVIAISCMVMPSFGVAAQVNIDKVKAVFLFKFFDYTSWSDMEDPKVDGLALLCVFGEHPFGNALVYIAQKKSRAVTYGVKEVNSIKDAKNCHIIYISKENYTNIEAINGYKNILTVGDNRGFIEAGGVIEMRQVGERIRLRVNLKQAKSQNVHLSSRLLEIADVIR